MGAVLSQMIDGKWRPITFMSKSFNEAERNYEIYDKEMLAMVKALEEWQQFLIRAEEEFEVWTDHLNLIYFRNRRSLIDSRHNGCHRWWTTTSNYSTNQGSDMLNQTSCQGIWLMIRENMTIRVRHGYRKTHGVPKTGSAGTGMVPEFHTRIDTAPVTVV
jgi:hypothetical protein